MTFLSKPSWYGNPILVRENARLGLRAIVLALGIAFVLSVITAVAIHDSPDVESILPIQVFVVSLAGIALVVGWFIAAFFFFRLFINSIRLQFHKSDSFKRWSLKAFYIPFYGFREQDLSIEGLRLRRLAVEGLIGFLLINGLIWLLYFAAKAVGVDLSP